MGIGGLIVLAHVMNAGEVLGSVADLIRCLFDSGCRGDNLGYQAGYTLGRLIFLGLGILLLVLGAKWRNRAIDAEKEQSGGI